MDAAPSTSQPQQPSVSSVAKTSAIAEVLTQGISQQQMLPPSSVKLEEGGRDQAPPHPWTQRSASPTDTKGDKPSPLGPLQELFAPFENQSDEESIASSISSATSDVVKPKRRRGRPRAARGRRTLERRETKEVELKGTGAKARKRQRRTRGGRAAVMSKAVEERDGDDVGINKRRRLLQDAVPLTATKGTARGESMVITRQ